MKKMIRTSSPSLDQLRGEIDALDLQIVALLSRRGAVAVRIGETKRREGCEVQVPSREDAVLARVTAANGGPLTAPDIRGIYGEIIAACLRAQNADSATSAGT